MFDSQKYIFVFLVTFTLVFSLFVAYYYYNYTTGQIEEAKILFERAYGKDADFNSIFWVCQKIFSSHH